MYFKRENLERKKFQEQVWKSREAFDYCLSLLAISETSPSSRTARRLDHPAPMWKPFPRVEGNLEHIPPFTWGVNTRHLGWTFSQLMNLLKAVFHGTASHCLDVPQFNLLCWNIHKLTHFFFIDKAMINVFVHKSFKMFPHHFRGWANNFVAFWQLKTIFFLI